MLSRTNTLAVISYAVISFVVVGIVFWSGSYFQRSERLIAELNRQLEEEAIASSRQKAQPNRYRSMRPALVRLERALDERTKLYRKQQDELKSQISGRDRLQQKYEKLSAAYDDLNREHQLLAGEIESYIGAFNVSAGEDDQTDVPEQSDELVDPTLELSADQNEVNNIDLDGVLSEFDSSEWPPSLLGQNNGASDILGRNIDGQNAVTQSDSLIAEYASHAMIEMGATAVPLLDDLLSDDQPSVRAWAAWVLGRIGPDASATSSKLEDMLLSDENAEVARAAEDALREISRSP